MTTVVLPQYARQINVPYTWLLKGAIDKTLTATLTPKVGWTADDAAVTTWLAAHPVPQGLTMNATMQDLNTLLGIKIPGTDTVVPVSRIMGMLTTENKTALAQNPASAAFWINLVGETTVNVSDPGFVAEVNNMVTANTITQQQATAILALRV